MNRCRLSAFLQGSRPLEFAITPQRPKACWCSGWFWRSQIRHGVGMDGTRQHHGLHQEERHKQAEACTCLRIQSPMLRSLVYAEPQLYDAAKGLKYLHDANMTHGNLKGVRF